MSPDLSTDLAGLRLPHPVLTAAGCAGPELEPHLGPDGLAAVAALVTRTVTLDPSPGAPVPRLAETPGGLLSATGHQNPGLQGFLATGLPWLAQRRVRTVVSVAAGTPEEYGDLARRLATAPGLQGVELRLTGRRDDEAAVRAVREALPAGLLVLAKLDAPDRVAERAAAAAAHGADVVVVAPGVTGLALDPVTLRPALGAGPGWLTGPAVHAVTLHRVWQVHAAHPTLPLVAAGGVRTGPDVLALLAAGARAVQLGTVLLQDPSAPIRVVRELAEELDRRGVERVADVVGAAHRPTDQKGPLDDVR